MSRVFLAYKRVDMARAQQVRSKLEALQVPLFMDVKMDGSQNYISVINQQLSEASAVLVLWTEASIVLPSSDENNFVISEAERGYTRKILVAAAFDRIAHPPVPFNTIHAPDLSDWMETGALQSHPQWQKVLEALGRRLGRPSLPQLALTLELDTVEARHAFLQQFPGDPASPRIASECEAFEREIFDEQVLAVEQRLNRRLAEGKRKLKGFREAFDSRIALLRQGKEFQRIDVTRALETKTETLQDELQKHEQARRALELRIEESDRAMTAANERAATLEKEISGLNTARQASADELAVLGLNLKKAQEEARSKESVFAQMMRERVELESAIAELREKHTLSQHELQEVARQRDGAVADAEDKERRLGTLQTEFAGLQNQQTYTAKKYRRASAAAVAALLIGVGVSAHFVARGPAPNLVAENAELRIRHDKIESEAKTLKSSLDEKVQETSSLRTRLAAAQSTPASQGGPLIPVQEKVRDLETQISRKNANIEQMQRDATRLAEQVRDKERALQANLDEARNEGTKLKDQARRAEDRAGQLQSQLSAAQTQRDQAISEKNVATAQLERQRTENAGAVSALQTQIQRLEQQVATVRPTQPPQPPARSDPISRCDDLASYQYDPDRPPAAQWKEASADIDVRSALDACEGALRAAGSDRMARRRVLLQLGRVVALRGMSERGRQQKASYDEAVEHWKEASRLGSSQANNQLGIYHQLQRDKDFETSWKYIKQSADQGNPAGLASAAYFLLFPELHENAVSYDAGQGQRYLDSSLRSGHPRALFVRGRAMMEGRGQHSFPNRDEGLKHLVAAFCGNDEEAKKFFSRTTDYGMPSCR